MSLLTCYIVDDEQSAVDNLRLLLEKYCPQVEVMGHAFTVAEARTFLAEQHPEILFLDIRMQQETGFDLLAQLPEHNISVVFITAYDEYGIQAIKFSAVDYLLKPVVPKELIAAVNKVAKVKKTSAGNTEQLSMLLQALENMKKNAQKKIALADSNEIRYVLIDDIVCCRSDNTYTTFHLRDNQKIVVSKPISEYEIILEPYGFVRTHQSYLVNKNKIIAYKKENGGYLVMEADLLVPVSRHRKFLLKELFNL